MESRKQVLIVDDEAIVRKALQMVCEKQGYRVLQAADGVEAQRILSESTVDLVVSDLRMPQMGGIELLRWIKGTRTMPVILMTGYARDSEEQAMQALGADRVITKPFNRIDFLDTIASCLRPT